jgi:hypothetical protein
MIAAFIFVFGVGAFLQFSLAYCRTLLMTYGKVELSERMNDILGLKGNAVDPSEFERLMSLVLVAPDPCDDRIEIFAVRAYHGVVDFAQSVLSLVSGNAVHWFERDLAGCSYFAAVTLDRRLSPPTK